MDGGVGAGSKRCMKEQEEDPTRSRNPLGVALSTEKGTGRGSERRGGSSRERKEADAMLDRVR